MCSNRNGSFTVERKLKTEPKKSGVDGGHGASRADAGSGGGGHHAVGRAGLVQDQEDCEEQ